MADNLSVWLEEHKGEKIILYDIQGRRFEGILQKVFAEFFEIFEIRQGVIKVFRFEAIRDFSLGGVNNET